MSRVFVDSFSGAVAELTRKQQADQVAVLHPRWRNWFWVAARAEETGPGLS